MVNVADLQSNGTQLSATRRLTLNEFVNAAEAWTPDSKAIVFRTARNGHLKLFRQALDSDTEEPLVMGAENVAGSAISPDGSWLFYLDCGEQLAASCEGNVPVMAMPLQGGTPHLVLRSDTYGRPRCTFSPANLCAVAEQSEDGKPLVFTAFDAQGRGPVVARFETEPAALYSWSLSPDGTRIAILKHWDTSIHVVWLSGHGPQEISIKGSTRLSGVYWAADVKGFFAVSKNETGIILWHVNLQGEPHPLITLNGDTIGYGMPSPDGRRIAIVATAHNNNVWMMENF
jgi:Tol biopolymer transport system component